MSKRILNSGAAIQPQDASNGARSATPVLCFPEDFESVLADGSYEGLLVSGPDRVRGWLGKHSQRSDVSLALQLIGDRWLATPIRLHAGQWWFVADDAWSEAGTGDLFVLESQCRSCPAQRVLEQT